jgi:hypothetical protein
MCILNSHFATNHQASSEGTYYAMLDRKGFWYRRELANHEGCITYVYSERVSSYSPYQRVVPVGVSRDCSRPIWSSRLYHSGDSIDHLQKVEELELSNTQLASQRNKHQMFISWWTTRCFSEQPPHRLFLQCCSPQYKRDVQELSRIVYFTRCTFSFDVSWG